MNEERRREESLREVTIKKHEMTIEALHERIAQLQAEHQQIEDQVTDLRQRLAAGLEEHIRPREIQLAAAERDAAMYRNIAAESDRRVREREDRINELNQEIAQLGHQLRAEAAG